MVVVAKRFEGVDVVSCFRDLIYTRSTLPGCRERMLLVKKGQKTQLAWALCDQGSVELRQQRARSVGWLSDTRLDELAEDHD